MGGRKFIVKVPDLNVLPFLFGRGGPAHLVMNCVWSCVSAVVLMPVDLMCKWNVSRWHFSVQLCHIALILTCSFLSVTPQSANEPTQSA